MNVVCRNHLATIPSHCIPSHCIASHITPYDITSNQIASHDSKSHRITSHDMTGHHITSLHKTWHDTTSPHISWHDITPHTSHGETWHQVTSHHRTWHYYVLLPHLTWQPATWHHTTSQHITSPPPRNTTSHHKNTITRRNGWRLVHANNLVWASHSLVALRTFYIGKFFLWLVGFFRPKTSGPGLPGNCWFYFVLLPSPGSKSINPGCPKWGSPKKVMAVTEMEPTDHEPRGSRVDFNMYVTTSCHHLTRLQGLMLAAQLPSSGDAEKWVFFHC